VRSRGTEHASAVASSGLMARRPARGLKAGEVGAVPAELRGEGGERGGRLGVELQVLQQRPPRDEARQLRLVPGGELRERQSLQPRTPAHSTSATTG
jgi:hypothetical protein